MHSRRRPIKWLVLVGALGLVATAAGSAGASSAPSPGPTHLLQAVDVALAPDGSIVKLTSTDISKTAKTAKAVTTNFSPQSDSAALPVSVMVGWVANGRTGTDLSQIAGASGTVEVDVTVTNTTVHSQLVTYTDSTGTHQAYALVGAPITVEASADLANGSFSQVQAPASGSASTGQNTNGVISTSGSQTQVQWETILAPPALSATTTFRLVEQTSKFVVPTFDISAQPGLITNPSTAQLIGAAFGGQSGSNADVLLNVENQTISLIDTVQQQLAQATGELDSVQSSLAGQTSNLASQAVAQLASTNTAIQANSANLLSDLNSLNSSLAASLGQATTNADAALDSALQALVNFIGLGSSNAPSLPPPPANCTVANLETQTPPSTLTGELALIVAQAGELASADSQCAQALDATLQSTIGPAATSTCQANATTLTCLLSSASTDLSNVASSIPTSIDNIVSADFPSSDITNVSSDITNLDKAIEAAQTAAENLSTGSTSNALDTVSADLSTLSSEAKTLGGDLSKTLTADLSTVSSDLQTVTTDLSTTTSDLSSTTGSGGVGDYLSQVGTAATALGNLSVPSTTTLSTDLATLGTAVTALNTTASNETTSSGETTYAENALGGLYAPVVTSYCNDTGGSLQQALLQDLYGLTPSSTLCSQNSPTTAPTASCPELYSQNTAVADLLTCIQDDFNSIATSTEGSSTATSGVYFDLNAVSKDVSNLETLLITLGSSLTSDTGTLQTALSGANKALGKATSALGSATSSSGTLGTDLSTAQSYLNGLSSTSGDFTTLSNDIGTAQTDLTTAQNDLSAGTAGSSLASAISALQTQVGALYAASSASDPANVLGADFAKLQSDTATGISALQSFASGDESTVAKQATAVSGLIPVLSGGASSYNSGVDQLLSTLAADLNGEAGSANSADTSALSSQVSSLQATDSNDKATLGSAIGSAVASINSGITSADTSDSTATATLIGDLATVLTDLGSPNGGGVLGFIGVSASQTGTSASQVQSVRSSSQQFSNVRLQEVGAQGLVQAQLEAGITYAEQLPAFEQSQPAGSTHLTVYHFTV